MKKTIICFVVVTFLFVIGSTKLVQGQGISSLPNSYDASLEDHKRARDIFRELIEINTSSKFGSTKAAEAMAVRLKTVGFPSGDIQVIGPDIQHKNLVFRYRGTGKLKPVLFICHLDVVEALRTDWSVDPFKFLEKDGYFYGRGTTDVKNEDASQ